jgi:hypothetical protein
MPSWRLTQSPPRQFLNQICWVQGKTNNIVTISNTVPTEQNYQFSLSDVADLAGLAGFFDQYCIYSVTVSISAIFEGAGSTLYSFGSVVTAIDYDNVASLGSQASLLAFGSSVTTDLNPGQAIQRYLKPCVAPALYNAAASFSGYGVERMWIDSSVRTVPHYGFRSFFTANTVSGNSVAFDINYVFGFRNNN